MVTNENATVTSDTPDPERGEQRGDGVGRRHLSARSGTAERGHAAGGRRRRPPPLRRPRRRSRRRSKKSPAATASSAASPAAARGAGDGRGPRVRPAPGAASAARFRRLRLPRPTRSAPAPKAPADVVLRTVNPSATPGGVLGVTGEGCDAECRIEFTIDGKVVGHSDRQRRRHVPVRPRASRARHRSLGAAR